MANFGTLYEYNQGNGMVSVVPDVSTVKQKIVTAFESIFGSEVSTDETTPIGRFIEAITLLFVDVLGVNAQNANSFNPNQALGQYLDAIGKIWGVTRLVGESDANYRNRILASQSRGSGYAQSISQAISHVENVTSVCVLENGEGDVAVVRGIALPAHSVFVAVGGTGYDDADVAQAIYESKSAGCGYQINASHGELVTRTVTDQSTGAVTSVYFHRAVKKPMEVSVTVNGSMFTGSNIVVATKEAIKSYVNSGSITLTVTSASIASAIAASGSGIVCTACTITSGGTAEDPISVLPYQYFNIADSDITVTVS